MSYIQFSTQFTDRFPADPDQSNISREVNGFLYSFANPDRCDTLKIVHMNRDLIHQMGWGEIHQNLLEQLITGQDLTYIRPYAMNYGGHQFGNWAGQLGDGRAVTLFECSSPDGFKVVQVKGSGPTPYSRGGDGFAVLRSSIREYLMSEAMYHLGISTTRALALSMTGDLVNRDRYYSGKSTDELGARVTRVADSFIRFGTFELLAARSDIGLIQELADYCIDQYCPNKITTGADRYIDWFEQIVQNTLTTLINWERVGFVHGVLNTDNMSILGLTLDYGPYGMMEKYDPFWNPNMSDFDARYSYGNQPQIILWNLHRLSIAITSLTQNFPRIQSILSGFQSQYLAQSHEMMCQKLGFFTRKTVDTRIIQDLKKLLHTTEIDITIFFRLLSGISMKKSIDFFDFFAPAMYQCNLLDSDIIRWNQWIHGYLRRIEEEKIPTLLRVDSMNHINPKYILRNWILEEAIQKAENGIFTTIDHLYEMIQDPYTDNHHFDEWFIKNPNPNASGRLSCSS